MPEEVQTVVAGINALGITGILATLAIPSLKARIWGNGNGNGHQNGNGYQRQIDELKEGSAEMQKDMQEVKKDISSVKTDVAFIRGILSK